MSKTKYILIIIFLCLIIFGLVPDSLQLTEAQTAATTFPVNEAGIAAYVKVDSINNTVLTNALPYFSNIATSSSTHVIGTVKVANRSWFNYPHLYIGLDGWMVAYYLKDATSSQIMQWKGYTPGAIAATTLTDAIAEMSQKLGLTYSTSSIKYYDFEFPEANKMAIIAETIPRLNGAAGSTNFSLIIPGILYESSYSVYAVSQGGYGTLSLTVDGNNILSTVIYCCDETKTFYDYYSTSTLEVNVPHLITLNKGWDGDTGAATILIYGSY